METFFFHVWFVGVNFRGRKEKLFIGDVTQWSPSARPTPSFFVEDCQGHLNRKDAEFAGNGYLHLVNVQYYWYHKVAVGIVLHVIPSITIPQTA
jgi:hypothetical protein